MRYLALCTLLSCLFYWGISCTPENKKPDEQVLVDAGPPPDTTIAKHQRKDGVKIKENATGEEFPGLLKVDGVDEPLFLMGTGVRVKVIINVYAMGYYLEPSAAAKALYAWRGKKPEDLHGNSQFYNTLIDGKFAKSMMLRMVFDVSAEDMSNAFNDSLEPRIKKLLPKDEQTAASKALVDFKSYFDTPAKKGQIMIFTWRTDGKMDVTIDGNKKGTLDSAGLAKCFFDIYLGDEPISGDAKKNFATYMNELIPTK